MSLDQVTTFLTNLREKYPKATYAALFVAAVYILKKLTRKRKSVKGKVVLITGGSGGLGKNMAKRFAKLGAKLVLVDINAAALDSVAKELKASGATVNTYTCDISNANKVYDMAKTIKAEAGKVDILINNAGVVSGGYIDELPEVAIERTFRVNVFAHFWTVKAFLPDMLTENSGHIVTIASAAGTAGVSKLTDYCASKWANFGFDEALRSELKSRGKHGVKTLVVCPYYINTGMFDGVTCSPLLPMLEEDYVCQQIINSIRADESTLAMPVLVYTTAVLRALLPTSLFDYIATILKINVSMDTFKGRSVLDKK